MSVANPMTKRSAGESHANRPELIVFSQYLLGGGASFHRNMLAHFPNAPFDVHCIFLNPVKWNGARSLDVTLNPGDEVFSFGNEASRITARRLEALISDREGAVVTNLADELICLDLFPKPAKTIYFICHDDGFLDIAVKFQSIIDVYISHNIAVDQALKTLIKNRDKDFYFIQHGVQIPGYKHNVNRELPLKLVFLARHYAFKGLFDLPVIDGMLKEKGCMVDWMILGDGPDREAFQASVKGRANFSFDIPKTSADVLEILKGQDIFILPSRKDGLPVALLESMSVGCVPLISNFSEGIKKVVTPDLGFVLAVGDNAGFAEKIAQLNQDRDLLARLSAESVEKVKAEFDISKQALEYFKLYAEYKKFRRSKSFRPEDLIRRLNYYPFFSKLIHFLKTTKEKFLPNQKITTG